jgi:uncharacterized membrane protein YjjB (DUF3815 family)
MLGGLGKGILFRLVSYAVFLVGFLLLFRAFENSNILVGVAGGAAVLAAMWLMVGFRGPSGSSRRGSKPEPPDHDSRWPKKDRETE